MSRRKKGEVSFFTIFFIIIINLLLAVLLFFFSTYIQISGIRNSAKMELNNLSAKIAGDTHTAMREGNLDAYLARLYSSNSYKQQLLDHFKTGLKSRIAFTTEQYTLKHFKLDFVREDNRVKYSISIDVELKVHLLNRDYPAVRKKVVLTGYHNFKFS